MYVRGRRCWCDSGSAAPVAHQPSIVLEVGVGIGHCIRGNSEITRKLTHCRQRITETQIAALDELSQLIGYLLERRFLPFRVDGEKQSIQGASGVRERRRA